MNRIILLLALYFCTVSSALAQHQDGSPFKLLSFDSQYVKLVIIEDQNSETKKGFAIFRRFAVESSGEVVINFLVNDKQLSNSALYKIRGYIIKPIDATGANTQYFFKLVDKYTEILEKKFPHRFVTKKRSCESRQDSFFQCLYEEQESWNTFIFVNNGAVSLDLAPVVDERTNKVIGGALAITYTIGTGKFLNKPA